MAKYAIVLPWMTDKKWDNYTIESLKEWEANGCSIFEECKASELRTYKTLVLYSLVPLDQSVLKPSRIYGEYILFDFPWVIPQKDYREFRDFMLSVHPQAQEVLYHPAPGFKYEWEVIPVWANPMNESEYKKLALYYKRYKSIAREIMTGNYVSGDDVSQFELIDKMLSVKTVAEKMNIDITENYVPYIDRVVDNNFDNAPLGSALTFAYIASKRSIREMKTFFKNNFNIPFQIEEEDEELEGDRTSKTIISWDGFYSNWFSYIAWDTKITDFIIRVRYCIIQEDGWRLYVVDLVGDTVAENVEFPKVFTKAQFKQKISHFWPFHFLWGDVHINLLHKAVSNTVAPEIYPLPWFGFHKEIMACENCVYDMEKDILYPKDWPYFYNQEERKWYVIVDAQSVNLSVTMRWLPQFIPGTPSHDFEEYLDYFSQFYKDTTWAFLCLYAIGIIYAGIYRYMPEFKFPYLILNGKYGSGKSAISDMFKRIYNIDNIERAQTKYGETTPFSFLNQCSYRVGFPMFITEFKEHNETNGDSKVSNLISMYDRAVVTKGTATQRIIYYNMNALGIIDGEELPARSAFKSRSVILKVDSNNNALDVSEYKKRMENPILNHLFLDCITRPRYQWDYSQYVYEWMAYFRKILPTGTPRLIEWFSGIYAWCMMFDSKAREQIEYYLAERIQVQHQLETDTYWVGEILEIIKKYARQMEYNDCGYYDKTEQKYCLKIGNFEALLHSKHIKTSLSFDSIRWYFQIEEIEQATGWLVECAVWYMWKHFPRQLLFNADAYEDYKLIK